MIGLQVYGRKVLADLLIDWHFRKQFKAKNVAIVEPLLSTVLASFNEVWKEMAEIPVTFLGQVVRYDYIVIIGAIIVNRCCSILNRCRWYLLDFRLDRNRLILYIFSFTILI